jgi:hypothetical protein
MRERIRLIVNGCAAVKGGRSCRNCHNVGCFLSAKDEMIEAGMFTIRFKEKTMNMLI